MKVLYAFQGTGNGHHTRAIEFLPLLKDMAEVDVWVSGDALDRTYDVPVDRRFQGVGFSFGTKGGIDWGASLRALKPRTLFRDVRSLDVRGYDLVLNDFEPLTAWAARRQGVPVVGLSHQAAVKHPSSPKPSQSDAIAARILENYAPAEVEIGFHFQRYAPEIRTPVIRRQVREAEVSNAGHITVYLPAYGEQALLLVLREFPEVTWEVFSRHWSVPSTHGHVRFLPASSDGFLKSMASSAGVLCGAGFETPAEALFLQKPLFVVPMRGQFEQQCNAAALAQMGVPSVPEFESDAVAVLRQWLNNPHISDVDYPDESREVLQQALRTATVEL
jgi:uncharacterized protein (TIGR00661 family)